MRLWTIQPPEVFEKLQKDGRFVCDHRYEDVALWHYNDYAYDWLAEQLRQRIGEPPEGVKYPIWAWHTMDWKHKKPDLRYGGYAKRGEKRILIEIEIPDDKVVLTDFDAWHYVLSDWYFDDAGSKEEWDSIHQWYDALPSDKQKEVKERSWLKIFDISKYESDWMVRGREIQATFWELRAEQVISHRSFVAK